MKEKRTERKKMKEIINRQGKREKNKSIMKKNRKIKNGRKRERKDGSYSWVVKEVPSAVNVNLELQLTNN